MKLRAGFRCSLVAAALAGSLSIAACEDESNAVDVGDAGRDAPRAPRPVDGGSGNDDEDSAPPCVPLQPDAGTNPKVPAPYAGQSNPLSGAEAVTAGAALYETECKRCHGESYRGGGDLNAADLTARARTDDYLFWRISRGGLGDPVCSRMPAFEGDLTDEERWQLVALVRSIGPDASAE